jgi:hypothetical protein
MEMKEILAKHTHYYEALVDHSDTPSTNAVLIAAAVLTLAEIMAPKDQKKD